MRYNMKGKIINEKYEANIHLNSLYDVLSHYNQVENTGILKI